MTVNKFDGLRSQLTQGRLLLPGDEGYEASLERWSLTCIKPAAAVAQPKTAEEVSAVVKFATANGIAFNVKGGGHSTSPSSCAPSPEGMVLDLSLMRTVSVDPEAKTISFGGGCLWGDVDNALWEHGLATIGGTVSHTGVGGLILHGGFGVLTGLHGMAVDALLSCRVVLADGSIVTASKTENPDLFWCLRGAGSSFGVVTEFTSQAFPQGTTWAGPTIFPADKLPEIVDFMNHWGETNDGNQHIAVALTHAPPMPGADPNHRPAIVIVQISHLGPNALKDGPEYFGPLLKLGPLMQDVGPRPYPSINTLVDEVFAHGRRYLIGGSNFTLPLKLSNAQDIHTQFDEFIEAHPEMKGSACLLECIPNAKNRSIPAASTAFNSRGDYYNIVSVLIWEDEGLGQEVRAFSRGFTANIRQMGYHDAELKDGVGQYVNYLSESMKADEVFGSNTGRLRELKQRYDPGNVFNKLFKLVPEEQRVAV